MLDFGFHAIGKEAPASELEKMKLELLTKNTFPNWSLGTRWKLEFGNEMETGVWERDGTAETDIMSNFPYNAHILIHHC